MIKPNIEFKNIMFIGDPHLSSKQISKRNDDEHFMYTILEKLKQCAEISHEKKSYIVFLGDIFDNDKENNVTLLTETIKVLKSFYFKPCTIIGNHEKTEVDLKESNMLYALYEADLIDIIDNNKSSIQLKVNGEQIEIGGTNYGYTIPDSVKKKSTKTDKMIWITHHDLLFKEAYPNAIELKEIKGVDIVVNGHMHKTQPKVIMQSTTWFCTGNITRQTIDTAHHKPSIWFYEKDFYQENQELKQQVLNYKQDIFKQQIVIDPTVKQYENTRTQEESKLAFFKLAEKTINSDNNKTSDKDIVMSELDKFTKSENIPKEIIQELKELFEFDE